MSYTEYLRRKAAAAPVIIDTTPKKVDASFYTSQKRMAQNRIFYTSSRMGVVNNVQDPSSTPMGAKQPSGNVKANGGRIPDASTFTSFLGGVAIGEDGKTLPTSVRIIANSTDAASISACRTIDSPAPYIPGTTTTYAANTVPQTASSFTNHTTHCKDRGRLEPHTSNSTTDYPGPSLFVDNMRRAAPPTTASASGTAGSCNPVVHAHPANTLRQGFPNRTPPTPMGPKLSTDIGRKVGAAIARHPYIEKHHGNDLGVNPRRVPTKYQIPANSPAHLKSNDPLNSRPA